MILSVDLAAKFSAGIVRGDGGEIHLQFDTLHRSPSEVAHLIAETAALFEVSHVFLEDVPYGISKQFMVKPVLRLQGHIIQALGDAEQPSPLFVAPATWQRAMGVWRASPADTAAVAAERGYTPPDLLEIHSDALPAKGPERTKIRTLLKKSATDYVDAFLLSEWALSVVGTDLTSIQGVQAT